MLFFCEEIDFTSLRDRFEADRHSQYAGDRVTAALALDREMHQQINRFTQFFIMTSQIT